MAVAKNRIPRASGTARFGFAGMENSEQLPGLTAELTKRGITETDLRKIYRDNFLRVMAAVVDEGGAPPARS